MLIAVLLFQIDISCSPVFYKWLLGQESHLGLADLAHIDPEIFKQVEKLYRIARKKKWSDANSEVSGRSAKEGDRIVVPSDARSQCCRLVVCATWKNRLVAFADVGQSCS